SAMKVLIFGPGSGIQEARAMADHGFSEVHLLDALPAHFEQMDPALAAEADGDFHGYLELGQNFIPELEGQMDLIFLSDVIDPSYMSPEAIQQITHNLGRYLKPGGWLVS